MITLLVSYIAALVIIALSYKRIISATAEPRRTYIYASFYSQLTGIPDFERKA